MPANSINDWGIELGFDSSKVDKGLSRIEKRMNRFNKNINKTRTRKVSPNNLIGEPRGSSIRGGNPLAAANVLERKRQSAELSIQKARLLGIDSSAVSGSLKSSNVQLIEKQRLALIRKIKVQEQRITAERMKQSKIKGGMFGGGKGGSSAINSITSSFTRLGIAAVSAYAVIAGGQALFQSIKRMDSLKASMLAASGSAGQAKIDFEFIRKSSKELGRDLFTSAKGFQAIGAAMRGSFTKGQTRDVFLAASEASTAFGLSVDDTGGVMRAFSQIASKGTVQAEELRGQLGDRLPGAFQIAAKAMGMTTDELNKNLKAGRVLSKDFLPKFAAELRKTVRESGALAAGLNTVVAAQNRMNTAMTESAERIGEAGGKEIFKDLFKIIQKIVEFITPMAVGIVKVLSPMIKELAGWVDLIFEVLTPIVEIVGSLIDIVVITADLVKSSGEWLFGVERVNVEIKDSVRQVSTLVRGFQIATGLVQLIQVAFGRIKLLIQESAEFMKELFGGDVEKNVTLKSGEKVSSAQASFLESSDRFTNMFDFLPLIDRKDRTGRIGNPVPSITNNFEIHEANDPDLVRKQVETGVQDALSTAMKNDE